MKNSKPRQTPIQKNRPDAYAQFEASSLFCPRCKEAVPVRKRLLLILPDGDKYEYLCSYCSYSLGTKMEFEKRDIQILG